MDDVYMDSANRQAERFLKNRNSLTPEESFNLFCEFLGVTEDAAAAYFNGHKFVLENDKG